MKKIRIVILNKARTQLYVEYKRCGQLEIQRLNVNRRSVLRVFEGRYEFFLGYDNANLEIGSGMKGVKDIEEIPSIANDRYKGARVLAHDPGRKIKLRCNGSISVAGLIENLS